MDKIVIWGATGQAIVMEELLMYFDTNIIAFFENNENVISPIKHVPIYYKKEGYKKWLNTLDEKDIKNYKFIIAIGGHHGQVRANIGEYLKKDGLKPYNAVHKTAFIAKNCILGEGCQVLANTSVCARVVLGNYCIVNTSASIDHECKIGNNTHIGPGAKLAGCTIVGENVFIGIGAVLLPRVIIGNNSIIGAGAVVTKDIPPYSVAVGNPAKVIKTIEPINFKDNKLLK